MWRLKLKLDSSKQPLGKLAIKANVSLVGYPLSYYKEKKSINLIVAGFMFGEDKNKKKFVRELKKSNDVSNVEVVNDFAILEIKQPLFAEPFYDPRIIHINPTIISENNHIWDLASFDRKILSKVLTFAKKYLGGELIYIKEEKISNISFTKVLPELTKKQKKALEIAIKQGYYNYPKKAKMEDLAEAMGISYSTYQAHLKKAEGKILPEIYKEL